MPYRYIGRMASSGSLVRDARERSGITQAQLAIRAGVSQAAISRLETSERAVSLETLTRLLLVMGEQLELGVTRLAGRYDPAHLAAEARLSPAQRLERSFGWAQFNDELLRAGRATRS